MPEPVNPSLQSTGSNLKTSSETTDWRALNLLAWPVLLKELLRKGEQCGDKAPTVTKSPKEAEPDKIRMLQLELAETERAEDEAQQKAKLLEDASAKEEMKQKKVETCPTDQGEESSRLLSGLTQAKEDLN